MRRTPLLAALALLSVLAATRAGAQIRQPTGAIVPTDPGCNGGRPTGLLSVFACACDVPGVCNIGAPCASETSCDDGRNATCEARMFHAFNDNTCIPSLRDGLDPRADARATPERFSPVCGLTFELESRGTALFRNAFGWYNATGTAPAPEDLHVMLPGTAVPGDRVTLSVRSDPDYAGGEVGFFLLTPESRTSPGTCAGGDCNASVERYARGEGWAYFSEPALNPDRRGADSFIHLLVYDSVVTERKFYFAWEDTFNAANNDFTDLVTSVEGVECTGGGTPCETGMPGACARGVSRCEAGAVSCIPTFRGADERCDGLDNDCDGAIDDAATCDDPARICHLGACVPRCSLGSEFECPLVQERCDETSGLCVEPACMGVTCPPGSVCRGGSCARECEGVVCPHALVCLLDACLDPCEGVTCALGESCLLGVCVPGCNQCNGLVCNGGANCDETTGACRDTSCATPCPAGTWCDRGTCRDACEGAVCPRGALCREGRCVGNAPGADGGVGDGGSRFDGGRPRTAPDAEGSGCACRAVTGGHTRSRGALVGALGALLVAALRGRRRPRGTPRHEAH